MKLLIGGSGQLGSELKKLEKFLCPLKEELDVTDFEFVKKYVRTHRPKLVINTSAYHQVEKCEEMPGTAFMVNSFAVKNLAEVCKELNIPLVHYSTDYVFDGEKQKPYTETDAPNPINTYGVSKLAGEYFIRFTWRKHFIIRPAAMFGIAGPEGKGSNFVEAMLAKKERVEVKDDEFVSPTYAKELAQATMDLSKTDAYGTYHITNKGQCSWYQFAQEIFRQTEAKVDCVPVPSSRFPSSVKRPSYSVLRNRNLSKLGLNKMSNWQDALKKYLKER